MSTAYYYFSATLPLISLDSPSPFTVKEFLDDCRRLLSPKDYAGINAVFHMSDYQPDNQTLNLWLEFEHNLRNSSSVFRAQAMDREPAQYVRGFYSPQPEIADALAEASKSRNPLEGERIIDRLRWKYLDDLETGHMFDFEFLVIYACKLKILERYREIASNKGPDLVEDIRSQAISMD